MDDLFKKIFYTGVGFASLAYKKMDELIDDLQKEGKLSEEEAEELFNKFRKETEHSREELEKELKDILEKVIDKMDLATKSELGALEKRIADLEQKNKEA